MTFRPLHKYLGSGITLVGARWFPGLGAVLLQDSFGNFSVRMMCHPIFPYTEQGAVVIARDGSVLPRDAGEELFGSYDQYRE